MQKDIENGFIPFSEERARFYLEKGCWQNQTLFQMLEESGQKYADQIAVRQDQKSLTYQELYDYAAKYGTYLAKKGLKEGDFVLIQSPNVIEFFVVLFGLTFIGARPVFCLNGHGAHEIENIARKSRAVGYIRIVDRHQHHDEVIDMTNQFIQPNLNLWYRQTIANGHTLQDSFPALKNLSIDFNQQSQAKATDIAFLQLSGGTTGLPKLIARTHTDYLYSVRLSADVAHLDQHSKQLIVLPVMHNFTMSSPGFLGAFYAGATVILTQDSSAKNCFSLIEKYKITQVSLVPALINLWINSGKQDNYDLSSLKVIQIGGAKLLPVLANEILEKLNITIQQVYGMAEGLVNFTHLDDDVNTIVYTQGKKLSEYDEIKILDDDGFALKRNAAGFILTRGPYTINGYYNSAEDNKKSFTLDGFYITGDIGFIDDNGNIVVTGRAKEQINRAGEKITPSELENLILEFNGVKDVCVIGIEDKILGEKIKVLIISEHADRIFSLREIRKFLQEKRIAEYKLPDEVENVSEFKYTHVGKIHKQKLK
ncbi:AMP-binding protein [Acinetobacter qingfengensis]|uniref:2,3-dihydroxybenzoate-AMP ligase n=2 Tax=Acinetobacter qingfengensis TaxID=1262585 RepID=A0A1E7R865_9GAMM|nr:AMP-binding protein [Acinetobacter qingfengensis]OEY95544.1 2,3-dihydroxybenzoate-AMP ligase [Acinetobacter qingfengensis]